MMSKTALAEPSWPPIPEWIDPAELSPHGRRSAQARAPGGTKGLAVFLLAAIGGLAAGAGLWQLIERRHAQRGANQIETNNAAPARQASEPRVDNKRGRTVIPVAKSHRGRSGGKGEVVKLFNAAEAPHKGDVDL